MADSTDRPALGDFAAMEPSRRSFLRLLSAAGFSAPLLVALDPASAHAATELPAITPTPTPPPPTPTPPPTTPPPTPPPTTPPPTPPPTTPPPTPPPTPTPTPTPTPRPVVPETGPIKGKKLVRTKRARYSFSSPTPGATFQARLEHGHWKACTSPYVVKADELPVGKHQLHVRAVLDGVVDPTPSTKAFRVIR